MRLALKHINKTFRGLVLLLALCFLVVQPLLQNNYFLEAPIFVMTQNDTEDDTEEEEENRQEDEKEDEKNESIVVYPYRLQLEYVAMSTNKRQLEVILQIAMDIHIPPPDRA